MVGFAPEPTSKEVERCWDVRCTGDRGVDAHIGYNQRAQARIDACKSAHDQKQGTHASVFSAECSR